MALKLVLVWALFFATWSPACWAQPGPAPPQPLCANAGQLFGGGFDISTTTLDARRVTTADFDGDGDMDVFATSPEGNSFSFFENGGGTPVAFTEFIVNDEASGAYEVAIADLDADGVKDVVVASGGDGVAWYKFSGTFPFTFTKTQLTDPADASAYGVDVVDVDGDGDTDIVYGNWQLNTINYFENLGADGTYTFVDHVVATVATPVDVKAADVNSDGAMDLLVASRSEDKLL